MEMDVDKDIGREGSSKDIEPVLRTAPTIASGRFTCIVCFESCTRKRKKAQDMQEVKDVAKLKARAELWTEYEHEYSSIFSKVNWTSKSLHVHKNCRTTFLKESVMSRQQKKTLTDNEIVIGDVSDNAEIGIEQTPRRKSSHFDHAYSSSLSSPTCIFCCAANYDSTGSEISVSTMNRKRL